jgi:hypothetical protein
MKTVLTTLALMFAPFLFLSACGDRVDHIGGNTPAPSATPSPDGCPAEPIGSPPRDTNPTLPDDGCPPR